MRIVLNTEEIAALNEQDPSTASDGGYQNYLIQLQGRVDQNTGGIELHDNDLEKIHRYAFDYRNGGWQSRLIRIFARNLGNDLTGTS